MGRYLEEIAQQKKELYMAQYSEEVGSADSELKLAPFHGLARDIYIYIYYVLRNNVQNTKMQLSLVFLARQKGLHLNYAPFLSTMSIF